MTSRIYKEDREIISFPHLLHSVNSKTLALSFSLFHFSFFLLRLDPWYLLIDIQLLLGRVSKFDSRESISDPIMLWIACILLEIQKKIQNLTSFSRFWIRNYCYLYCGYVLDFIPWLDEPRNKIGNFQILERERVGEWEWAPRWKELLPQQIGEILMRYCPFPEIPPIKKSKPRIGDLLSSMSHFFQFFIF